MKILLIALTLLVSQTSFAQNECILRQAIRNFKSIDTHTVEIDAGPKDYTLEVSYCDELKWSHTIAFDTMSGSRVCRGDRLLVLDNFSNNHNEVKQICRIFSIERIK